ncbi:RluA family pseudouridine synthase [Puniceicoccaceae bacterium K14]|nr:RluA family pseudouridine synthase [Puniceicoccaceae bacterium K14]
MYEGSFSLIADIDCILSSMTSLPDIEILFEDSDLMVVNKPAGVLSESSGGGEASMLDKVSSYLGKRAIAYHRIDRSTSGCLLMGKTARFNKKVSQLFQHKRIRKEYWAIVEGDWDRGLNKIETYIGALGEGKFGNVEPAKGKLSITTFRVLKRFGGLTWLQCLPKTGRTHQIRLHCLEGGRPILGDDLYNSNPAETSMALHARSIQFPHPNGDGNLEVKADPPVFWNRWLQSLADQ